MNGYLAFPEEPEALADAMDVALSGAMGEKNVASVGWLTAHHYLQGCRDISVQSWNRGSVLAAYENDLGELMLSMPTLNNLVRVEKGRLMRMLTGPSVGREGFGLDSVRNAGVAQAILSYMAARSGQWGPGTINFLRRVVNALVEFGCMAVHHYRCQGDDIGSRTAVEVVMPWELYSVPGKVYSQEEEQGITRCRKVPMEWLLGREGLDVPKNRDELEYEEVPFGARPSGEWFSDDFGGSSGSGGVENARSRARERDVTDASRGHRGTSTGGDARRQTQQWVRVVETWLYAPQGYLGRYIVKAGRAVVLDQVYYDSTKGFKNKVVPPIYKGTYSGPGFYGRGYAQLMLGITYELEKMLANQFQNVSDMDQYPFVAVPANSGLSEAQVKKPERRKVLFYEPDPVMGQKPIYTVEPPKSGLFPAKVLELGMGVLRNESGQGAIYQGDSPGRTESAASLGFLYETGNVNLVEVSNAIGDAMANCYASMLQAARVEIERESAEGKEGGKLKLPILDDRMIGVVVDLQTGEMSLSDNPVPEPWEVKIDVEERTLRSKEQQKQEAGVMLEAQIITDTDFRILNEKLGLGFPVLDRSEWEAWRKAVVTKILLFRDGRTPGTVTGHIEADNPEIMLRVIQELMASMEFAVASVEVQDAFVKLKQAYEAMLPGFPDQLPGVESPMMEQQGMGGGRGAGMAATGAA
jgi:hypothetical protein